MLKKKFLPISKLIPSDLMMMEWLSVYTWVDLILIYICTPEFSLTSLDTVTSTRILSWGKNTYTRVLRQFLVHIAEYYIVIYMVRIYVNRSTWLWYIQHLSSLLTFCDLPSFVFTLVARFCQFSDFDVQRVTVLLHVNWSQEEDHLN